MSRGISFSAMTVFGLLGACIAPPAAIADAPAAAAAPAPDAAPRQDADETVSLDELKTAAGVRFDELDKNATGKLSGKGIEAIVGKTRFKAADTDHDGALSKDEYLALVEKLFDTADTDHDGSLTVAELRSPAARALRRLCRP